jgi:hypothetical protein
MILKKLPHCLNENVLLQTLLKNLLDFRLILCLQYCSLLLKQDAHTVKGQYLQRFWANDPVEDEEELLGRHIPYKAVENPRKNYLQWLDLKLFKLSHDFFLSTEQQLLEKNAKTFIKKTLPKIESGSDETVLSNMK